MRILSQSIGKPPWLISLLVEKWKLICIFSPILSIFYLSALLLPEYNERTRTSENALLPALVTERFDYYQRIVYAAQKLTPSSDRHEFIRSQLESYGINVQMQSYNISFPNSNRWGTNLVGFIHASRSPSVESILVAVSLRDPLACAVSIALASHCREQLYWARNIIFVFVDSDNYGMMSFLADYHGQSRPFFNSDRLEHHTGPIVGAFAIEIIGSSFDSLNIKYNMVNGVLPNLDLINLMVRLADKFALTPSVYDHSYQAQWLDIFSTTIDAIKMQAFVNDEGLHSPFGLYGIQAVTIEAKENGDGHVNLLEFTRLCEGALRSLNNILERFHQSYFLYILPNCRHFISVAYYISAFGLLLLPLSVLAMKEWFSLTELCIASSYIWLHVIGVLCYFASRCLVLSGISSENLYIIPLILFVFPYYFIFPLEKKCVKSTKFFFYLEYSLIFMAVSLLNFSLALIISLISTPLIYISAIISDKKSFKYINALFVLFNNPSVFAAVLFMRNSGLSSEGFNIAIQWIKDLLETHLLIDCYLFAFIFICVLPLWNIFIHFNLVKIDSKFPFYL